MKRKNTGKPNGKFIEQPHNDCDLFPVGEVVGLYGCGGELKIRPSTNNPSLLLDIRCVEFHTQDKQVIKQEVQSIRLERRLLFLICDNFTDRTAAEFLLKARVFSPRAQLRPLVEDEWWIRDLVGLKVCTTDGVLIGTICDIVGNNGQLLEVTRHTDSQKGTILIPFVNSLVPVVDIAQGRVEVVNLPGLFD